MLIELFVLLCLETDIDSNKYTKTKINSDDDLTLEKTLNTNNLVICNKFIFNKNYNNYYYNYYYYQVFIEKCSYK